MAWLEAYMRRWCVLLAAISCLAPPMPASADGWVDQARLGVLAHDIGLFDHHAEAGIDVNAEVLFASPGWLSFIGGPHPNLGATINSAGGTSYGYFGLAWTPTLWGPIFAELGLGGAVHDGELNTPEVRRKELGSRILFHEELELGYRVADTFSLSVFLDHISNANLSRHNQGLTNLGMRAGFFF
jgi:lipid A 3-O-deacylase